jgi:hemolysin-activating ACP:hemolysin acyltransferase
MSDSGRSPRPTRPEPTVVPSNALGIIGALVFFWQQSDSFWQYVLAVLKALVWPALRVYEAFQALQG